MTALCQATSRPHVVRILLHSNQYLVNPSLSGEATENGKEYGERKWEPPLRIIHVWSP